MDDLRYQIYVGEQLPAKMIAELVKLLAQHNTMASGNVIRLSATNIQLLRDIGCWFGLVFASDTLIGCMISYIQGISCGDTEYRPLTIPPGNDSEDDPGFFVPLDIDPDFGVESEDEDVPIPSTSSTSSSPPPSRASYTSYLCLASQYRSAGIAQQLIQQNLETAAVGLNYYTAARPHHGTLLELRSWFRPLNYDLARRLGFELEDSIRSRLRAEIKKPMLYTNRRAGAEDLHLVQTWSGGLAIKYMPTPEEWSLHCRHFLTYLVSKHGKPVCIYMLFVNPVTFSPSSRSGMVGHLSYLIFDPTTSLQDRTDALKMTSLTAQELGACVLLGYELGQLDEQLLGNMRATICRGSTFLEFRGLESTLPHPREINLVLF